jgi:hypothetical protein
MRFKKKRPEVAKAIRNDKLIPPKVDFLLYEAEYSQASFGFCQNGMVCA